ncbi:MAG: PD40 domain-containing protein [Planctomycetes bacterium]|nr:PD40 domain-containing protein [Planctomycetota bacterium]MBI3834869.1 PD40 domain-containing protein [Planctomycetota bacterium]
MTLAAGTQLGPYTLTGPLGAGGMGEVYRARDTRLDRDVAIKVLPDALARDKERILRFEREAKVLASLNHPNIAAIYGFEEFEGKRFLVMELAEGETLAERLDRGPIPMRDALELTNGIAIALEAAHEKGIVHRDLKPANVKVTPDGTVKVLDFGLAKAMTGDATGTNVANSPTITMEHTRPGVVLGTAAYMSPEQARGKPLDKRTDVWSFGALLFECMTNRRPFEGETTSDLVAKILEREPDWNKLPPQTPTTIRLLLRRCLAKDRTKRLRDIGDARIEIENAIADPASSGWHFGGGASPSHRALPRIVACFAVVTLLSVAAYSGWRVGQKAGPKNRESLSMRFTKLTDFAGVENSPSLSPDGKTVVYVARDGEDKDIFSLRVGGLNPINLTKDCTQDDTQPAFSPDGTRIVFRSERDGGGLFVMGATGESPRRLTDFGFDPKWSPDGQRVAFATEGIINPLSRSTISAIWTIDLATGEKKKITDGDAVQPSWSPHGNRIAYWVVWQKGGQRDIYSISANGGEPVAVTSDQATDWFPVWSPDGRFIYFDSDRGGSMNIWRIAIDEQTGRPLGKCEPVTSGVTAAGQPSLSSDGRLIAFTATVQTANIERLNIDPVTSVVQGLPQPISHLTGRIEYASVSPDGEWIACTTTDRQEDLILLRKDGSERRQLTNDIYKDRGPAWSPDGKRLAFYSDRSGKYEIWTINFDGSNLTQLSRTTDSSITFPRWSRDGSRLFFSAGHSQAVIMNPNRPWGEQTPEQLFPADLPNGFTSTSWSADGRSIAGYMYDATSMSNLGVVVVDMESKQIHEIAKRGEYPEFLHDGRRIIFAQDDHRLMLTDIEGNPPQMLLDVAPDGLQGYGCSVSSDDTAIFYTRVKTESDVWLLQLE